MIMLSKLNDSNLGFYMRMNKFTISINLILIILMSGYTNVVAQQQESKIEQEEIYQIKKGDILTITVMEHPEFSISEVVVLSDGFVQFPGIGRIKAIQHSPQSLTKALEIALKTFVVEPLVTIYVRKIQRQTINVFGFLSKPGQYQIFEAIDVLSAISLAGGFPNVKRAKSILVIRKDGSQQSVRLKKFMKNTSIIAPLNIGDTLFIQPKAKINWGMLSFITTTIYAVTNIIR